MASLNMANMNTLFKKGYLLAGVLMAANMFVVNEVKASDANNNDDNTNRYNIMQEGTENNEEKGKNTFTKVLDMASGFVLSRENTINLIGGVVSQVLTTILNGGIIIQGAIVIFEMDV